MSPFFKSIDNRSLLITVSLRSGNAMMDNMIDKAFGSQGGTRELDPASKAGYSGKTLMPSDIT